MSDVIPPRPDLRRFEGAPSTPPIPPVAGRPAASWEWWQAVGVYLGCWLVASIVTLPVFLAFRDEDVANLVASAVIAILNVAILLFWLSRRHPGWARAIGFPPRVLPEIGWGIGFGLLLYPMIAFVVGIILTLLFREIVGRDVTTPTQVPHHLPAFGVIVTILYAVVIAPIHEELFFRGILFRSLRDRYGFLVGATMSAIAFGLVHYIPAPSAADSLLLMSIMVFTGIGLAGLYEWRGNIVASMAAHAAFNTVGVVLIFLVH